jgi:LysM repeat protein
MAEKYGISTADTFAWNGLNSQCTNLRQEVWACVGMIGDSISHFPTSSAQSGNDTLTPAFVQPRIARNYNKFYFVESGDTCNAFNGNTGVQVADITSWNGLISGCTNNWGSRMLASVSSASPRRHPRHLGRGRPAVPQPLHSSNSG